MLAVRPGVPGKRSHDYIRHGTTALFAALEAATGPVTGACYPRHRHEEFLTFLEQVAEASAAGAAARRCCDDFGTRTHPEVSGLARPGAPGSRCTSRRRPGRG